MRKLKDFTSKTNNNKKIGAKRDGASIFLIIFGILFIAMIGRVFFSGGTVGAPFVQKSVPTVELSFSDVLRRASDIKTMTIKDNLAIGNLADGTKYTATITYDPEMLTKLSDAGTSITIDTSKDRKSVV